MVLNKIKQALTEYNMIDKGDSVLVGLSGGADSVCLTHALWTLKDELGIKLYTAHLNHGIRGNEAARDEGFAKTFSEKFGIECFVKTADIPKTAQETGCSEEAAGRKIRYEFFSELCEKYKINRIATAHNKNDNAETLLMNFMRGSSTGGLCGIPYKRGSIIRPILNVSREEIEQYCAENNLDYVTDSTNLTDDYTRNKIRHKLIPFIKKEFNANFVNTSVDNSVLIKEDNDYLEENAFKAYSQLVNDGTVMIQQLMFQPIALRRRIVRYMLKDVYTELNDISSGYVSDILALTKKQSGTKIQLADNVTARNEYGKLIIERDMALSEPFCYEFYCGEKREIPEIQKTAVISWTDKRIKDGAIYLSCGVRDKIVIRSRCSGDKFQPAGMTGSKKIKDYFINEKIPKEKRNSIPIIEINGVIAAVGRRVDRNFLFKDSGIRIEFSNLQEVTI
ncbi:MAG: tRNA lysidine(34) synthetase TilS [Hominilimicola sp.]